MSFKHGAKVAGVLVRAAVASVCVAFENRLTQWGRVLAVLLAADQAADELAQRRELRSVARVIVEEGAQLVGVAGNKHALVAKPK